MSPDLCVTSARPVRVANSGKVKRLKRKANSLGTLGAGERASCLRAETAKLAEDAGTDPVRKEETQESEGGQEAQGQQEAEGSQETRSEANGQPEAGETESDRKPKCPGRRMNTGSCITVVGSGKRSGGRINKS